MHGSISTGLCSFLQSFDYLKPLTVAYSCHMTTQETVAANVRARLAWSRISHEDAAAAAGLSLRSFRYRIAGEYPFQVDELGGLARLFEMEDLGAFFRVPEGFTEPQRMVKMNWGATPREATRWLAAA